MPESQPKELGFFPGNYFFEVIQKTQDSERQKSKNNNYYFH